MASVSWPPAGSTDFPQVAFSNYRMTFMDNRIITQMDSGVVKMRSDVTKSPRELNVPIQLNGEQLDVFMEFIEELRYCADRFDWTDPLDTSDSPVPVEMEFIKMPEFQEICSGATKKERIYTGVLSLRIPVE